ncbi:MAG: PQQ-binding-like beta-propeller repeat protein [Candidatus Marinimicrobia bacterium]|nr:PQQ-binding-like beta-propeller repeat protein [Candidatus Neomarinimicrobiota bacterium]
MSKSIIRNFTSFYYIKRILKLFLTYTVIISFFSCSGSIKLNNLHPNAFEWQTEGKLYDRTNYLPDSKLSHPLSLAWKERFIAGVSSSPVLSQKLIIIPFLNSEVFVLRLSDGKKIGRKKFGVGPIAGLSIIKEKLLLSLPSNKRSLIAYNLNSGKIIWTKEIGSGITAPTVMNDFVYCGTLRSELYCISMTDGEKIWKFRTKSPIHSTSAVSHGILVVVDRDGTIYAFKDHQDSPIWERQLENVKEGSFEQLYRKPVIGKEKIFIAAQTGNLYALSLVDGKILWTIDLKDPIYSSVSIDETHLFIGTSSGKVFSIDQVSGKINWTFDQNEIINQEILVLKSGIMVPTLRGEILWLDKNTAKLLDKIEVEGRIITALVATDRYVIVSDDKKWVYAFTVEN